MLPPASPRHHPVTDLDADTAPLLRAERRLARLTSGVVLALPLAATPPILLGPTPGAIRASAAAGIVAALGLVLIVVLRGECRLATLQLIAEGHEDLPLLRLAEARAELLRPSHRQQLAADIKIHATRKPSWAAMHPAIRQPGSLLAVAGAVPELERLATLLAASAPTRAEPLAACELLLIDGASSPLHGRSEAQLRDEADRIAALLADAC